MNLELKYEWHKGGWWYRVLSHSSDELSQIFDIALSVHEGGVVTDKLEHLGDQPIFRMWVSAASCRALEEAGEVEKIYRHNSELPSHADYPGHFQELLKERPNQWTGIMDLMLSGKLIWCEPLVPLNLTVTEHRALHGVQTLGQWLPTWSAPSTEFADILAVPDIQMFYKACGFLTKPSKTEAQNLVAALTNLADTSIPIRYVYRNTETGKIYQKVCRHDRLIRVEEYFEGVIEDEDWENYKTARQISTDAGSYLFWRHPLLVPFSDKSTHILPWLHYEDVRMVRRLEGGRMSSSDVMFMWWIWGLGDPIEITKEGVNRYELPTRNLVNGILNKEKIVGDHQNRSKTVRILKRVFELYKVLGLITDYNITSKKSRFGINRHHPLFQQNISRALCGQNNRMLSAEIRKGRGQFWPVSGDYELILAISSKAGEACDFKIDKRPNA